MHPDIASVPVSRCNWLVLASRIQPISANPADTALGPTCKAFAWSPRVDARLSEPKHDILLTTTATELKSSMMRLSQTSSAPYLHDCVSWYGLLCVGRQRRLHRLQLHVCAISMQAAASLSRHARPGHAGAVWATGTDSSSTGTPISTSVGVWWSSAARHLQAAAGLATRLQIPARPDLRARGMCPEGCSLNHAQPQP